MTKQKNGYDELRHKLDTEMLQAANLPTEPQRRGFVNRSFLDIHRAYQAKRFINQAEYVRLINRLAAYRQGEYNDYIDVLAGSAHLGMLEMAIQGELSELSPEQARQCRDIITGLTGVEPSQPEEQ